MMYSYSYNSPLGEITLAANNDALTGLWFVGQKYYGDTFADRKETGNIRDIRTLGNIKPSENLKIIKNLRDCNREKIPSIIQQSVDWLNIYFSGKEPDFMPAVSLKGTPFQMEVWNILKEIPYGQTMTYGEIAVRIARQRGISRMSAQAVGGAVGRNPISIIIPCHRVVGANGSLTGYAGGIDRKRVLLKLERK